VPAAKRTAPSSADATRAFIDEHPSIRQALQDDFVHIASLARKIQAERDVHHQEAVEIAARRYQQEMMALGVEEMPVRAILRESKLEVRSRMAMLRIREDGEILQNVYRLGQGLFPTLRQRGVFQMIQGSQALTILCGDDLLGSLLEIIPEDAVLRTERGLATLTFRSDPSIEETPGVIALVAELLYRSGLNFLETVSVHTDSTFVFREEDVIRAYGILADLTESGANAAPRRRATPPRAGSS
jgi:hypothetical protein